MVQHWMSWCRLCAREDHKNSHINVLLKEEECLPLTHTIAQCFSIDMNNFNNNLPGMICTECYRLIGTIISFNQRIAKANAMFAELQVKGEEELDAHLIKIRYNLDCDFKVGDINPLGNTNDLVSPRGISAIDEQMIDQELLHCNETKDSNPINIKIEEDEMDNYDPSGSHSEESSNGTAEKKTNHKDIQKTQKKYKSRKERQAEKKIKPHYCSECHKGFIKLHNYKRHMQSEHDITIELKPPLFICENCGKEYKSISALKEHEHSHTEERTLKCKYCEKTFKGIPSLRAHEDTHNETNYICVVCGLKLNTQRTLRMHMVVHSDKKKHKCDHCGNEFKRAKDLKNHLILHTGLKPYSCDFCDRTFASGANWRSHKKKNHPVELAAQEAAGTNISKARIPKLRELKAVTARKAETSIPNDQTKEINDDSSLELMSGNNASLTLKSVVSPNDMPRCLSTTSLVFEKPSPKEESELFHGIFGKKYGY